MKNKKRRDFLDPVTGAFSLTAFVIMLIVETTKIVFGFFFWKWLSNWWENRKKKDDKRISGENK